VSKELIIFDIQDNRFALPASAVSKVLDPLVVTPLPYAPPQVEGLVNVSGSVLLKVDLCLCLGMAPRSADAFGNLLVVMTGHESVAVQVDRVHNKISLDDELITLYPNHDGAQGGAICGEFSLAERTVLLLDQRVLDMRDMSPNGVPESGAGLVGLTAVEEKTKDTGAVLTNDLPAVTVEDGQETYALHMTQVQEIVELGPLTSLPGAGAEVLGLMQLRGRALLVVSLAGLLDRDVNQNPRFVLVVDVQGLQLGLGVSNIYGIERYASDDVQAVGGGNDSQLEGWLSGTADRQGHMTGLLSMSGLLSSDTMARYRHYLTQQQAKMTQHVDKTASAVRRLLSFRLGSERCALSLKLIDRVEEYTASVELPEGDESLAGVIQIKGEIAPVLDLRSLLGITPQETSSYVVVRVDGEPWALVVDRIERVIEIEERNITPVRNQNHDYLSEVGKLNGELVSLLTLEPLTLAAKQAMN
jgi:chemotaxis signal transduction protein